MSTQQAVLVPQVQLSDVENFTKVWTYNGIAISLDDASKKFALDFANLALRDLMLIISKQIQAAQAKVANDNQPKTGLIVE